MIEKMHIKYVHFKKKQTVVMSRFNLSMLQIIPHLMFTMSITLLLLSTYLNM